MYDVREFQYQGRYGNVICQKCARNLLSVKIVTMAMIFKFRVMNMMNILKVPPYVSFLESQLWLVLLS